MANGIRSVKRDALLLLQGCLRFTRSSCEQLRQARGIDAHRRRAGAGERQLEHSAVKALVQHAEAVALEPEHLDSRRPLVGEHEQSAAALRILPDDVSGTLR